ncbi:uncharacterized protein [Anabrus simplex]|uniref:uncharacterized protein n=1 Tax=Anabrus simplex TaxID=316456 RepID=UPI0035A371D9
MILEQEEVVGSDEMIDPILRSEFGRAFRDLNRNKAPGIDDIPSEILTDLGETSMARLFHVVCKIFIIDLSVIEIPRVRGPRENPQDGVNSRYKRRPLRTIFCSFSSHSHPRPLGIYYHTRMKFVMMKSLLLMMFLLGVSMVRGMPTLTSTIDAHHVSTVHGMPTPASTIDPNHVPSSVCANMSVSHGTHQPSNSTAPYKITTSPTKEVTAGSTLRVAIAGIGGETFRGVYIQGRTGDKPVGQFRKVTDDPMIVISDCQPGNDNAASYISRTAVNEVVLDWVVPETPGVQVVFKASLVKTFSQFWEGVVSEAVSII